MMRGRLGWFTVCRSVGATGRSVVRSHINASYSCAFHVRMDRRFFQADTLRILENSIVTAEKVDPDPV